MEIYVSTNHAVTIQALWSSVQSEQAIVDQLGKPFVRTCYTSEKHQFKISSGKPSFLYMFQLESEITQWLFDDKTH